jgi:hypothetical protein
VGRVYNGFSSFRLFADGYQAAAGLYSGLAKAAGLRSRRLWLAFSDDLPDSEGRRSRQRVSDHLPGSLFDARYKGLAADAARLDAAIRRQERLR